MMKSVILALSFLFVSTQVEAEDGCSQAVLVEATKCLESKGININMFTDVSHYLKIYLYICKNGNLIDGALACVKTVVDKCKDDKSLGIGGAIMSQVDFDHVKTAFQNGCSRIKDLDGQTDCLDNNMKTVTSCSLHLETQLTQKVASSPNPSQAVISDLMCSSVTRLKKCIQESFGSCGKAVSVISDFLEAYRPKIPCS